MFPSTTKMISLEPINEPTPQTSSSPHVFITSIAPYTTPHNYQNNMLDPYFMHPTNNQGLAIISPQLNIFNYHSLFGAILVAMCFKNNIYFIDGTLVCPIETDILFLAKDKM